MHIAVDWPGDPGFKSGALPYCAMAIVVSETAEEIEAALRDVRTERGLRRDFEFKHAKTVSAVKDAFMDRLAKTSFTGIVVVYDKRVMNPPWAWGKNDDLLAQLIVRGLLQLPREEIEDSKMVRSMLSRDAKARGLDYRLRKIVNGDSKAHGPLQLADMIGGAAVDAWQLGVMETPLLHRVRGKVTIDVITPEMEKPAK